MMRHSEAVKAAYDYPFVQPRRTDEENDDQGNDWEGMYRKMGCNPNYTQETDSR